MKIKKQFDSIQDNERGMVLVVVLLLTAALIILGTTAVMQTSTDLKIGSNYKTSTQAFYDADAGVQYVLKKLADDLDDSNSSTVNLSASPASPISLNYSTPSGFSFTPPSVLTPVTGTTDQYSFSVTGHGPNNSSEATIEIVLSAEPKSVFDYGLFADGLLDLKASAELYSYDSRDTPNPDPADFPDASTGEIDIGSNTAVSTKMDTYVDGDLALGADDSDPPVDATWSDTGTPTINGEAGTTVGYVDPDPLGANDPTSELYDKFIDIVTTNNNVTDKMGTACPLAGATDINLANGEKITLTAGDYYITSIILKNGAILEIDATAGPVNIYLNGIVDAEDGDLEAKNGSEINNLSQPTDFSIFSNSDQHIVFKHDSVFKGMVYAPNADVQLNNSAGVYGLIWGKTVGINNSGGFYFDEAIKDKYLSPDNYTINVLSWKDDSLDN